MLRLICTIEFLKKLVYAIALVCFIVLLVTGFSLWFIPENKLSGYLMMTHVTFAPVFGLCMAALAVMYAYNQRFDESDWLFVSRIFRCVAQDEGPASRGSVLVMKLCFWLICVGTIPLILSIVLSMFPIFGSEIQDVLLELHRYSSLVLSIAGIVHTFLLIMTPAKKV